MKRRFRIVLAFGFPLLLTIPWRAIAGEAGSRIMNGTQVPATSYPTVAQITDPNNPFYKGTGTLISPQHVLTAAHVVTDSFGTPNLTTANQVFVNGSLYNIAQYVKHPSYIPGAGETENQFDVAIITLATPVVGASFTPISRVAPQAGDLLTLVGYGSEGTGSTGPINSGTPNGIVDYGFTRIGIVTNTFIKWDFTSTTQSSTAHGDSGGPAFIVRNNVAYLAGSTQGGTDTGIGSPGTGYGNHCWDVRTDRVSDFIDTTVGFTNLTSTGSSFAPSTAITGHPISVTSTVANQGFVSAPPFVVRYALSRRQTASADSQ